MSLFIRHTNKTIDKEKIDTMDQHLAVVEQYGRVYWGLYSKSKSIFTENKLSDLQKSDDKRVVFYANQEGTEEIYVGQLEAIYSHSDKTWDREAIKHLVSSYYRDELSKSEDSAVAAWLQLSQLVQIDADKVDQYLDQICLASDENPIRKSLRGQGSRFYIVNRNTDDDVFLEGNIREYISYIPTEEEQRKFEQVIRVRRDGQSAFRKKILETYNYRCCISSCPIESVLEAAHVTQYNGLKSDVVTNGMCLRADLHKLWDKYMIAIHPESKQVEIADVLENTDYVTYKGKVAFEGVSNQPTKKLLNIHYQKFKKTL